MAKRSSRLTVVAAPSGDRSPRELLEPLNALDDFVQELQRSGHSERQLQLLLKTLNEALCADAVFLLSLADSTIFETAGRSTLAPQWCRELLEQLLANESVDRSQFVRVPDFRSGTPDSPSPTSTALLQISKSRKTWVVALTFKPDHEFQPTDIKVMMLARRLLMAHSRQLQAAEKLKETMFGLIHCLTSAIDAKDPYTCGHSERVARIATRLGQAMNMPEAILSDLYLAGLLHDVGKIGVEDQILRKPGQLTEDETRQIQLHPVIGDRIIASVRPLAHLRPGVRNHHERYDGQGYPDQLAGLEIPLLARILAVADSCDAMMSARPYRTALPPARIEVIFSECAGTQWDPQVVEAFMSCRQDLYGIGQRGIGDSLYLAVGHAVDGAQAVNRSIAGNLFARVDRKAPALR